MVASQFVNRPLTNYSHSKHSSVKEIRHDNNDADHCNDHDEEEDEEEDDDELNLSLTKDNQKCTSVATRVIVSPDGGTASCRESTLNIPLHSHKILRGPVL